MQDLLARHFNLPPDTGLVSVARAREENVMAPSDRASENAGAVDHVQIGGVVLDVIELQAFNDANIRRFTSFITNFGNWTLPADIATALGAHQGHLEWVHETGELILLGGVPHIGSAGIDVPAGAGSLATGLPAVFGGTAVVGHSDVAGMVRLYFNEEVLPMNARVVILGRVRHGPRVHEVLWGWHEHHRRPDGWNWLVDRLGHFHDVDEDDQRLL